MAACVVLAALSETGANVVALNRGARRCESAVDNPAHRRESSESESQEAGCKRRERCKLSPPSSTRRVLRDLAIGGDCTKAGAVSLSARERSRSSTSLSRTLGASNLAAAAALSARSIPACSDSALRNACQPKPHSSTASVTTQSAKMMLLPAVIDEARLPPPPPMSPARTAALSATMLAESTSSSARTWTTGRAGS